MLYKIENGVLVTLKGNKLTQVHEDLGYSVLDIDIDLKADGSRYDFYLPDGSKDTDRIEWTEYLKLKDEFHEARDKAIGNLTVTFGGKEYQANELSQFRMSNAITALEPNEHVPWVAADNTVVLLTSAELVQIKRLAGIRQAAMWNEGRPEAPSSVNPF